MALDDKVEECLAELTATIGRHESRSRTLLAGAYEARASAWQRHGDLSAAETDLSAAIRLYEGGGAAFQGLTHRPTLLTKLVALQIARGAVAEAFDVDEWASAFRPPPDWTATERPGSHIGGCNLGLALRRVEPAAQMDIFHRPETRERPAIEQRLSASRGCFRMTVKGIAPWIPDDGDAVFFVRPLEIGSHFVVDAPKGRLCDLHALARDLKASTPRGTDTRTCYIPISKVLSALPQSAALLKYKFLDDRLFMWTVADGELRIDQVNLSAARLEGLVKRLRSSARRSAANDVAASETLFNLLIEPARERLRGKQDLVVIPDGTMAGLPFALLRNPTSGNLLVEDHSISLSPTVGLYVDQLQHRGNVDHSRWTALRSEQRTEPQ